ncbi:hypothetical protein QJS10_CPA09g00725 [Acorus calamus]|uniref:KIB1-4 beta-propeller domain-containing protein n=1 Tax=Acorus calamus TaxID=4465 RepID=A0AAV9E4F5_ACOCL|nr:hypothetical protein QJS10_CPA09g00725 [Acorus calamus]
MRMDHLSDYVRFGGVCKSWRSAIIGGNTRTTPLYSPLERKLHPIRLPDRPPRMERFLGSSSDGWLCMVDDEDNLYLRNPFFSGAVSLPCSWKWTTAKWPGDARWTVLKASLEFVNDVVFFNENLYVVDRRAVRVVAMDLHQGREMMVVDAPDGFLHWMHMVGKGNYMHLAAGPSGPLLVLCHLKNNSFETERFQLFVLDDTLKKWVETRSLDEGMLFLGWNTAIWLSSSSGLKENKGNSIYFIDENKDLGIFYLEDGAFGSVSGLPSDYSYELAVPIP